MFQEEIKKLDEAYERVAKKLDKKGYFNKERKGEILDEFQETLTFVYGVLHQIEMGIESKDETISIQESEIQTHIKTAELNALILRHKKQSERRNGRSEIKLRIKGKSLINYVN